MHSSTTSKKNSNNHYKKTDYKNGRQFIDLKLLLKSQEEEEIVQIEYSVHQLQDDVLSAVNDRIVLKGISVYRNYTPRDLKTKMNEATMKIALTNIIINAIEAIPSKNGRLDIITKYTDSSFI